MKQYIIFGLLTSILILTGCSMASESILSNMLINNNSQSFNFIDYSFVAYEYNCTVYNSTKVSDLESLNISTYPVVPWFSNITNNWYIMGCHFDNNCNYMSTDVNNICTNSSNYLHTVQTISTPEGWRSLCSDGVRTDIDENVDPTNPLTSCDMEINRNTASLRFNQTSSLWDSVCCRLGVQNR